MIDVSIVPVGWRGAQMKLAAIGSGLADMAPALAEAVDVVYEHERQLFDSWGDGRWPPLAEATVQRKASQGYAEPARPLYATGNLFESATSPYGPYSVLEIGPHEARIGIDWDNNGHQIPVLHQEGTSGMPARPIFGLDDHLVARISEIFRNRVFTPAVLG